MKLQHRTVLITGGTSGIGLEIARQLLARTGNTVIVTGRDAKKLAAAQAMLPGLRVFESDVTDPLAVRALCAQVVAQFPNLEVLVNNAGIMRNLDLNTPRDLLDLTREIDTNLSGPLRMVQQFLPHLRARPEAAIVNVSSGLAFVPLPIAPIYSATKAALHSYTQSLRIQMQGTSVQVYELAPPGTETPLFRGEFAHETKDQKAMAVDVLVQHALAGIEAAKTEIRPGLSNVLASMGRIAPQFMLHQLAKMKRYSAPPMNATS